MQILHVSKTYNISLYSENIPQGLLPCMMLWVYLRLQNARFLMLHVTDFSDCFSVVSYNLHLQQNAHEHVRDFMWFMTTYRLQRLTGTQLPEFWGMLSNWHGWLASAERIVRVDFSPSGFYLCGLLSDWAFGPWSPPVSSTISACASCRLCDRSIERQVLCNNTADRRTTGS